MRHLGVNFGGIWRFKLGFLCVFMVFFSLKNFEGRSATVLCDKTVAHCNYKRSDKQNFVVYARMLHIVLGSV